MLSFLRTRMVAFFGLIMLAGVLAACGGNSGSTPTVPTPAPPAAGSSNSAETVVTLNEWAIDPKDLNVAAGRVKFKLVNAGKFPHNFGVTLNGQNIKSKDIDPGSSDVLELDLTAGTYKTVCDLPQHEQKGMVGSITVK